MKQLKTTLSSGEVTRYHAVPTVKPQNLAHHQWNVAVLLLWITDFIITKELLSEALLHDTGEIITGDIPYTMKRDNPTFKSWIGEVEHAARCTETIHAPINLTTEEVALLKVADTLDGFVWCHLHEERQQPVEERWHQAYLNARVKFAHVISDREWARADAVFCAHGGILRDAQVDFPCTHGHAVCAGETGCPIHN